MKLSSLIKNERRLAIELDGDTLNVVYRPSRITPAAQEEFSEAVDRVGNGPAAAAMLALILVSWDLEADDGPYPHDEESLRSLPLEFVGGVFGAIMRDLNPNAPRPEASAGGSLRGD